MTYPHTESYVPNLIPRDSFRGILLLGEAPGADEEAHGSPFIGLSGKILAKLLSEVGLVDNPPPAYPSPQEMARWWRQQGVIVANVCPIRPPNNDLDHFSSHGKPHEEIIFGLGLLSNLIRRYQPRLIIALGNWPLWAMTSRRGITKWRGSMLLGPFGEMVMPTYHPAAIARMWEWRPIMKHDLLRAARHLPEGSWPDPAWQFTIRPSFTQASAFLSSILRHLDAGEPLRLAHDAETRQGHIACWGIATSPREAICIPFMDLEHPEGYWSEAEEIALVGMIRRILTHPNAINVGQNFAYDAQYTALWWACVPRLTDDTMIQQHVAFAGLPKSLDFLSSMYCSFHVYWKDDGKNWDPRTMPEEQLWLYNCRDAVATWESSVELSRVLRQSNLAEVYHFQMSRLWPAVLRAMIRGIAIDHKLKGEIAMDLLTREAEVAGELGRLVPDKGKVPWYQSSSQTRNLFYRDLGIKPIIHRKTGRPTVDDEALKVIAKREPLVRSLIDKLLLFRSLRVFNSTFIESEADPDGRMRSSYNIAGTETYRFSSSTNAFGRGMNLQNIPKHGVTNVRRLFVPDPGYLICDSDLARADAQVVAWEADAPILKQIFREGLDLHSENAKLLGVSRQLAKTAVHLCLTEDHEVLTPCGWMNIVDACESAQEIMVWALDETMQFQLPSSWYRGYASSFIELEGEAYSQLVTTNHKLPAKTDNKGYRIYTAETLPASASLPKSGFYIGGQLDPPEVMVRLACAYHAEGKGKFLFKKERKIARLKALLEEAGIPYTTVTYSDGVTSIAIPKGYRDYELLSVDLALFWSQKAIQTYLAELEHWHRGKTNAMWVTNKDERYTRMIQTMAHLTGHASAHHIIAGYPRVSVNNRPLAKLKSLTLSRHERPNTPVICPTVSTGYFLVRRNGKISVTGNTNYAGSPTVLSRTCNITMKEAEAFQKRYFDIHPEILAWHRRIESQLHTQKEVRNAFGYRRHYFGRTDNLLKEALAWIPQSTVACVINRGWAEIESRLPWVKVLMQVHDSLVYQIPKPLWHRRGEIRECLLVTVPYPDPLIIPVGLAVSEDSWGDVKEVGWE